VPHWTDHKPRRRTANPNRRGAATLDFALVLGVLLPIAAVVIGMGSRIMQLVYEMLAVFLAWPFM
jgi:hypothetical protein